MDESPGFHVVDAPTGDRRADTADQEVAQGFGGDRGGLLGVGGRQGKEQAQGEGEEATEHWDEWRPLELPDARDRELSTR